MKTVWGIYSEMLIYVSRILNLFIPLFGTPVLSLGSMKARFKIIGDNYASSLYKKNVGRFGSNKFVKRKWLLFFVDGPGPVRSKPVFDPN